MARSNYRIVQIAWTGILLPGLPRQGCARSGARCSRFDLDSAFPNCGTRPAPGAFACILRDNNREAGVANRLSVPRLSLFIGVTKSSKMAINKDH